MGRHSAPDDEDEVLAAPAAAAPRSTVTYTPRRLRIEPEEEQQARPAAAPAPVEVATPEVATPEVATPEATAPVEAAAPEATALVEVAGPEAAAPAAAPAGRRPAKGTQSTAADLALLRRHSATRNRVVAAVVVPFVLYTVVLVLIGAADVYLIWVWIPLVTAGVVAGSILDAAHRRHGPPGQTPQG